MVFVVQALQGPQLPQPVFVVARTCQRAALTFDNPNCFKVNIARDTTLARAGIGSQRHSADIAASITIR